MPASGVIDLESVVAQIENARGPFDLFGEPPRDGVDAYLHAAQKIYKSLQRKVHPDTNGGDPRATGASARLNSLWDQLQQRSKTGTLFGVRVKTARGEWLIGDLLARGDISNVYRSDAEHVVKVARLPQNSDLIVREAKAYAHLDKHGDPKFRAYAPALAETFGYRTSDGKQRQTNVISRLGGFHSLQQVRQVYPGGIDARDAAWIWRRMLVALGWAHRAGVIHGAVLPEHVMIQAEQHGVNLIDWCYSVIDDRGYIPAIIKRWEPFYPDEVRDREAPTPATDIYMAAKVFRWLLDAQAPRQIRAFIKACTVSAGKRPADAWELLEEFDELIVRLYGPRKFRVFPPLPETPQ